MKLVLVLFLKQLIINQGVRPVPLVGCVPVPSLLPAVV